MAKILHTLHHACDIKSFLEGNAACHQDVRGNLLCLMAIRNWFRDRASSIPIHDDSMIWMAVENRVVLHFHSPC